MKSIDLMITGMLILLLLAGCGAGESEVVAISPPQKVIQVETLKATPRDIVEEFTLPGSLEAWQDLRLAAEVAGVVEQMEVEEGDQVRKGQTLVHIDTLTLQANYDGAHSDYILRKKTHERLQQLHEEQLVSSQELDNAVSALDIAAANQRTAKIMLNKGRPSSPLNGLLEERYVEPGEYVSTGDPLVRVVQLNQLKINVDVPEKDIQFLRRGQKVQIDSSQVGGWGYGTLTGKITHVGYVADKMTRTYRVRIELSNPDEALRPGMIVRTRFVRRKLEQALTIPLYAVVEREGHKYIFLAVNGEARQRKVRLGVPIKGETVILDGLEAGEEVIIKGQQLLLDKVPVQTGGTL